MEGDDLGALARRMQEELGLADGKPVSGDAAVRFLAQASSLSHAAASAVCSHMLDAGVLVTVSKPRMGIGRRRAPAPTKFRADSTLYRIHPGGNATVTNPLVAAASSAGAAQSELGGSGDVGPGPVSGSPRARSSDGAQSHASSGRWSGSASSVSNSPRGGPALGGAGAASDAFARDEEAEYALSIEPAQVLESGKRFEGFLEKRGNAIFADWRRRWAVLSGSVLGYFEDCDEATALGVIDLAIPDVALHWGRATNAKYKRRLVFEIQNPKRTYAFQVRPRCRRSLPPLLLLLPSLTPASLAPLPLFSRPGVGRGRPARVAVPAAGAAAGVAAGGVLDADARVPAPVQRAGRGGPAEHGQRWQRAHGAGEEDGAQGQQRPVAEV